MMRKIKLTLLTGLLLIGAAGCAEMDVTNPNNPQKERVVKGATDLEGLIAGSWLSWWEATTEPDGVNTMLSAAAFQHAALAANFGMVERSAFPRLPVGNHVANAYATEYQNTWDWLYRAIASANDGLFGLGDTMKIAGDPVRTARAKAFAYFVQGLAHGSLAIAYDKAFIVPETFRYDPNKPPSAQGMTLSDHKQVLEASFNSFDKALALAKAHNFSIPAAGSSTWLANVAVSNEQFIRMIHSYKARFRADAARTPEERKNVDWTQVLADIADGIQDGQDFMPIMNYPVIWYGSMYYPGLGTAWGKAPYVIYGMADTTGNYQQWMATKILDRTPILIASPDRRFPQGVTSAEQAAAANKGLYISYSTATQTNAERGTWRWSHYFNHTHAGSSHGFSGKTPELTFKEMRLLKAEALYRQGDLAGAADLINITRVANGQLPPVTADYAPTAPNCVPRLPSGACGDLFEALKWEKRLETYFHSFGGWYFNSRGWGDLPAGSFLDLPVPARDLQNFGLPVYTTGGVGGNRSAPGGIFDPQS